MIFKNIAPDILVVVVGSKIQYMQIQSLRWKFIIFQSGFSFTYLYCIHYVFI